jgi:alkaline phosphatase D
MGSIKLLVYENMKNITFVSSLILLMNITAQSQLQHMIGYVDMREATIWIGSDQEQNVLVKVGNRGSRAPQRIFSGKTSKEDGFSCKIAIDGLEPATTYQYTVTVDAPDVAANSDYYEFTTQTLWQYRTDPPNFKLAIGSCAFINESAYDRPGEPYGGSYGIFDSIVAKDPDLMLWLGDNIYLREVDFGSKSGIYHRYRHCRSTPEMQKLMTHCPNVAIWDDHDFGPNDANGSFIHKDWTLEAFRDQWANPSSGVPGTCGENGIATSFQFSDVEFFLLDNRYNRTGPNVKQGEKPTILGDDQLNWLIQALAMSKAPFKMVAIGGQFLNTEPYPDNYSTYPEERQKILDAIDANNITGVIFLTGDRHCGELSELKLPNGNLVYDLTVSPLTSKAYDITKENNTLRVPGTIVADRHFATLNFSGKRKERVLTIEVHDYKGTLRYKKEIKQPAQ